MSYLCVPIFVRTIQQARRDMAAAVEAGAQMIELRVDTLPAEQSLDHLLDGAMLPVIVTCRPTWEGGYSELSHGDRAARLLHAAQSGAHYLDVELESLRRNPTSYGNAKLILSIHDFYGRPARMNNLLLELDQIGCDVRKLAWMSRSVRDNLEAFEILLRKNKPTIALCMGECGIISRILANKFGAFLTYASLNQDAATAPGQVTIADLKGLYRWEKVGRQTKVYGVVAHPVGHSMSPAIHNAAFDATGFDGVYVPLLVNPGYESFKAFMESFVPFEGLNLSGLSVTLPHKENALRYLQEKGAQVEELATKIGAVNTIIIDGGKLSGINTDYAAILQSITTKLGCERKDLAGIRVAVLGAGGTGRTAAAALRHCGALVSIFNRTKSKADELASEFGATSEPWEALGQSDCRIYINTTSVGMHPHTQVSPFGDSPPRLNRDSLVFDTIYNPMKTLLLSQAEAAGAQIIGGVEMFVHQAAAQFNAWTHQPAPTDVMRAVIERRLS